MNAACYWLVLHADLPPGERRVCFRTRDEQREHKRRFGGVLYRVDRMH